jgi:hypothetical protein
MQCVACTANEREAFEELRCPARFLRKERKLSEARLQVLDVLKEHDCKATFFVIGSYMDKWPQLVERMHREGERPFCFTPWLEDPVRTTFDEAQLLRSTTATFA